MLIQFSRQQQAVLYALVAVLLWSTVATAFKIALRQLSPLQLMLIAVSTSIVALGLITALRGELHQLLRQFMQRPYFYLGSGLLNPFLYYLVLFKAYDLLPAQQALSLNYTWAILLPLLSVPLLHQPLKPTDLVSLIVAYIGVVIIATNGNISDFSLDSPLGLVCILSSTVIWCLYWIFNTKDQGDPVISLLLSFMLSLPVIVISVWLFDTWPTINLLSLAAGIYVGLFEMGVTFTIWLMALKRAERTATVATLIFLSPLLSMLFVGWILAEVITASTLVGLTFILFGLLLQKLFAMYTQVAAKPN